MFVTRAAQRVRSSTIARVSQQQQQIRKYGTPVDPKSLKKTALYDFHAKYNAKFVVTYHPFSLMNYMLTYPQKYTINNIVCVYLLLTHLPRFFWVHLSLFMHKLYSLYISPLCKYDDDNVDTQ